MRLYPVIPLIIREGTKDYTLSDGTFIEKGTSIIVPIFTSHRDPQYFPEPLKFNPDRFEDAPIRGSYLPFGEGPRICIGKQFLCDIRPYLNFFHHFIYLK